MNSNINGTTRISRTATATAALLALAIAVITTTPAAACGPTTDCRIGDRTYRIRMPKAADTTQPIAALVHTHGYRGTANGVMRNKWLRQMAQRLGIALIAPQSKALDWALPNAPKSADKKGVDELAYFDALLDDVTKRFPIDPQRIIVSGFSAGGMMVWNLACHRSTRFAGFIPIAGTFWRPVPPTCDTPPASIIHLHGDRDRIVPLRGRPIADTHQGEVPKALAMYTRYGDFGAAKKSTAVGGRLKCEERTNARGQILAFCLFSGGHTYDTGYVRHAWERLIAAKN